MILAVGTKSPPKIKAIEEASQDCIYFKGKDIQVISEKVESGISDMPLSLDETILGAKNRANNIKKLLDKQEESANFYIGIEGGTTIFGEKAFLFGIVYIISEQNESHFGMSNFMELPKKVQKRLYENGEDLGIIMDNLTGMEKTKKGAGAFGHLSDNHFTRKSQLIKNFYSAIAPFYNQYYK